MICIDIRWAKNAGIDHEIKRAIFCRNTDIELCPVDAFVHFMLLKPQLWVAGTKLLESNTETYTEQIRPHLEESVGAAKCLIYFISHHRKKKKHRVYDIRTTAANELKAAMGPSYTEARGAWLDGGSCARTNETRVMKLKTSGRSGLYMDYTTTDDLK